MPHTFDTFFQAATGNAPYAYQRRLACGERGDLAEAEWLANGSPCTSRLISDLVAAHHGKVRLSLWSTPDDLSQDAPNPCPEDKRPSRVVRDDAPLPEVNLPGQDFTSQSWLAPVVRLHLDVIELGLARGYGPSWRERMESLLVTHDPFRLAWYETVLRTADQRASRRAQQKS